jgi:hypothetical protein
VDRPCERAAPVVALDHQLDDLARRRRGRVERDLGEVFRAR